MAKSEYFRDRHLVAVMQAAQAAGVKGATLAVLSYMCSASAFTRPTVCVSKETICARTGYAVKAVKAALARLRDAGILVPVACFEGGRNRATVYKLTTKVGKGGQNDTAIPNDGEKGGHFGRKGVSFSPERGVISTPPSISSSISSSRREKGRGLDAPDAAPHGALPPEQRAELARFSRDVTRHGYAEARRMADARAAGVDLTGRAMHVWNGYWCRPDG